MTQFKHAGVYECIAKTTLNQEAKSTPLVVYGKNTSTIYWEISSEVVNEIKFTFGISQRRNVIYRTVWSVLLIVVEKIKICAFLYMCKICLFL